MRLLVHGSGFVSPFSTEIQEIKCGKPVEPGGDPKCNWSPSNPDFVSLGNSSGGSTPAANLIELAGIIERQTAGSIDELRILGHSSNDFFALGGTVVTNNADVVVRFAENTMMGQSATFLSLEPRFHRMRDRFAPKGRITLAGCGSGGTNSRLLELVSRSFLCCVSGFQRPIQYAINATFPANTRMVRDSTGKQWPVIGPAFHINQRGRVSYSPATLAIEERLGADYVNHLAFQTSAWELQTDAESCVGQQMMNAAGRVNRSPIDNSLSSFEVGWRIVNEFFPAKAGLVASVGYDANLRGLRVEVDGPKVTIVVGKPFVLLTNPSTIDQRVAEMGEALQLAEFKRKGVVPMK